MKRATTERQGAARVLLTALTYIIWPAPMRPGDALCLYEDRGGIAVLRMVAGTWTSVRVWSDDLIDWRRLAMVDQLQPFSATDAASLARLAKAPARRTNRPRAS